METAETVPMTTPLIEMVSALAMRTGVLAGSQQFVGVGKPLTAYSGRRQTCAPESTTAPGTSTSKGPEAEGMEMRTSRRGWPLKEFLAAATMGASNGCGSGPASLELCFG